MVAGNRSIVEPNSRGAHQGGDGRILPLEECDPLIDELHTIVGARDLPMSNECANIISRTHPRRTSVWSGNNPN